MWKLVERAEVAARPGLVWRVVRELPGSESTGAPRIDTADEPRELAWTSVLLLVGGETEVQAWFRLAPSWNGTEVEHGLRGADVLAAVDDAALRRRLVATLSSVKARAQSMT